MFDNKRANLIKIYDTITTEKFEICKKKSEYQKLLFSLSWFHTILLERRKFKTLGFNIPYEFNESDFLICHDLIIVLLNEYNEVPFEAMRYLIGEANYGGRVTEDTDRRLINVYVEQFFCPNILELENFRLSNLDEYYVPSSSELVAYKKYIHDLPHNDHPDAFGQHPNADISSQIENTHDLLNDILSLQQNIYVEGKDTKQDRVQRQVEIMYEKLPEPFDMNKYESVLDARSDPDAMKTVLHQELGRYNVLISILRQHIDDLKKAIVGMIIMTTEIESMMKEILDHKVPTPWLVVYPSSKPLGSWMLDLQRRIDQMRAWVEDCEPKVFWLGGFTYPTGLLTGILQSVARKNGVAIDTLGWGFEVFKKDVIDVEQGPEEGAYMSGIYIEGAKWDLESGTLAEPTPMELLCPLPIIHFKPTDCKKKVQSNVYNCPLYMYPIRAGSRERPSFVINVELNCGLSPQEHWVKRGVALILSTSK